MSDVAKWAVIVSDFRARYTLDDPTDMLIGPFTSETRAEDLARRINEGTNLDAEVHGLYPPRDEGLSADLLAWSDEVVREEGRGV
jgi:hypothetical protein